MKPPQHILTAVSKTLSIATSAGGEGITLSFVDVLGGIVRDKMELKMEEGVLD